MSAAVLFLTDLQEGSCAEAGRQGLSRFGNGLALAAACRPDSLPAVGLFSLAKKANRVQLQVKLRPSPFLLSDWHHSVAKLSKGSRDHVDAAQLALALANLLEFLSSQQDAPERSRVVLLCDRPYDDLLLFEHPLQARCRRWAGFLRAWRCLGTTTNTPWLAAQTAKLKNIGIDVMALCSDSDTLNPGVQAATESWRALQAAHLSTLTFTQVEVGGAGASSAPPEAALTVCSTRVCPWVPRRPVRLRQPGGPPPAALCSAPGAGGGPAVPGAADRQPARSGAARRGRGAQAEPCL